LILRLLQDRTYEEMADILTLPLDTIKTGLFRARNLLKQRLLAQHCEDSHGQQVTNALE
jgi:RNA polymerase sigma-70 factor, ECF subfamily